MLQQCILRHCCWQRTGPRRKGGCSAALRHVWLATRVQQALHIHAQFLGQSDPEPVLTKHARQEPMVAAGETPMLGEKLLAEPGCPWN